MNCYVSFAYGVNMFSRLLYEIEPGNGVGLFWDTHMLTYLLTCPDGPHGAQVWEYIRSSGVTRERGWRTAHVTPSRGGTLMKV